MKLSDVLPFRTPFCGLALLTISVLAQDDLSTAYCSSQNTGSSVGPYYNIYNSMGSCSTKCQNQYALAIVQGKNCWCSNYIPADQTSTSNCNEQCPGYPSDLCGNSGQGLYGYVALNKPPLGTAGAASGGKSTSSPSPASTPDSASEVSPTVTKTVTEEQSRSPSVVVSYVTPAPSSYPPSSSTSTGTTTTKSLVVTKVTTISGNLVTQTVTTGPVGAAPNSASTDQPMLENTRLSDGAIAGAVIGAILGLAAIALATFLLWRRRSNVDTEGGSRGGPKRKGSVLSRAGLLGGGRPQSMSENNYDDPYSADPITRPNSVRHSIMFGAGVAGEGIAPVGPLGTGSDSGSDNNRLSKPMVYDQRLNPTALWVHHDNGSRTSMQDQQDYSRPLGLANPDPTRSYSFDSR